jgi:tRNA A-37 threonylcarbamoyl transferase component Bud32
VEARAFEGLCPRCVAALNLAADTVLTEVAGGERVAAPTPAELAPHFPQLEILELLGRGGMGVVYKARQKTLNRLIALKLLAPERVRDPKFAERFSREAQALAALNHPHIVTVYDFGEAGGFYYLLMQFVDGVNLRQAMRGGRLTPEQALAVVPPVCEALQYAHENGIVHRDIKPENLLLNKTGRVMIADFGIARMLGAPAPVGDSTMAAETAAERDSAATFQAGTPQYMAPEQRSEPQRADHRADIYSLGVVLYEMLTGKLPDTRIEAPSRRVQVDVRLDEVVLRALEKSPELRWQTAAEMRTQVETIVAGPAPSGDSRQDDARNASQVVSPAPSRAWLKWAAMAIVLCVLVGYFLVEPVVAKTEAALPGLRYNHRCLVWKHPAGYAHGDVVVFQRAGQNYFGRVTASTGSTVTVTREGEDDAVVPLGEMVGKVVGNTRPPSAEPAPSPRDRQAEALSREVEQLEQILSDRLEMEKELSLIEAAPEQGDANAEAHGFLLQQKLKALELRERELRQRIESLTELEPESPR